MRPTIDSIVKSFQNSGKRHFLITGNRGIGKTTLFLKLRELLCSKESNIIPGIKTYAVPQEKVMLQNELTGEEAEIGVFRNSWMETVSSGFQNLGVKCVKEALDLEAEWFTMDEIGFLESKEEDFKDILYRMFDTKRVLAVIRKQDIEFLNSLKNREDVYLIDMDEMRLHVGCVVMASGISKRFGENKLLVDLGGETLIERVLKLTDGPVFARRIVVTRTKEVEELCKSKGIDVILHEFPGRGDAVRLGMEQMMDLDGCMFCPCDQPFLLEKSLNRMVGKFTYGEKTIFKLGFEEKHGAPVLFSKEYFEELCNLPEKSGGSYIMKRYPEEVDIISAESEKELWDMDTKEDYERMRCSMGRKKYKRIFAIVIDSLGVGAMEDAGDYGDNGADTLGHIVKKVTGLQIPNLRNLGIANICNLENILPVEQPLGYHTKLREASNGKDTMTGHWEMMGLLITTPFQTFTENGFPKELIDELSRRTGRVIIGNKSASGTEILDELAEEEIATGHMIVYTSADSVLQICGNEETFGLEELYRCCEIARELTLKDEWKVGRVIARPYVGRKKGEFKRTSNRHDYALKPFGKTVLNVLKDAGYDVISVGKIFDIFDGEGITESNKSKSSVHGMEQTIEISKKDFTGLCFVNLVDFDALWGHRRNVEGYAKELESFDKKLGELLKCLKEDDLLIITADHGNDPTHTGTDHTREKVPFLAYSPSMRGSGKLEEGTSFANVGATIADNFNLEMPEGTIGNSYLEQFE